MLLLRAALLYFCFQPTASYYSAIHVPFLDSYSKLFMLNSEKINPYRIIKNDIPFIFKEVSKTATLMSVDLGLRSGFAFYNSTGHLIRFSPHRFISVETLQDSIQEVLKEASLQFDLTHFVLEGDLTLSNSWKSAIRVFNEDESVEIINVSPSEWRGKMLIEKERKSGKDAKAASRQISRQIMWRSGINIITSIISFLLFSLF